MAQHFYFIGGKNTGRHLLEGYTKGLLSAFDIPLQIYPHVELE